MSKPNSTFVHHPDHYSRELDFVEYAIQDAAHYLHIQTGKPLSRCIDFVKAKLEGRKTGGKDIVCAVRTENGDRELQVVPLGRIVSVAKRDASILSPNLAMYDNPNVQRSFTGEWILKQKAERSSIKHKVIEAQMRGDETYERFGTGLESRIKFLMNSISGARVSEHNPLFFKTIHSTLTSICRVATSYSNASTERLLYGNRHYNSYETTRNSIITTTRHFDAAAMRRVVTRYNLYIPTPVELLEIIRRSTQFYWRNEMQLAKIAKILSNLDDMQRCAVAYIGDMYHLREYNSEFMRNLITTFISPPAKLVDDPDQVIKAASADMVALCGYMCIDQMRGRTSSELKAVDYNGYVLYASTIANITNLFIEYDDLIQTLLVTDNIPSNIYHFPKSIRRSVVGSDTDSTMFTVQDWVSWYFGKIVFTDEANRVSNIVGYFSVQLTAHWLARLSKQLGVVDEDLYQLSMKNEFYFALYLRANRAKHYFTLTTSREGKVFPKPKLEVKGVGLKDSKIPPIVMAEFHKATENLMLGAYAGSGITITDILLTMVKRELDILDSLSRKETKYLPIMQIKGIKSYKSEDNPTYKHYDLWNECFAPTYGITEPPPYVAYKLPVMTDNHVKTKAWLETLPPEMATKLSTWLAKNKASNEAAKKFTNFLIPKSRTEHGFPAVLLDIVDFRSTTLQLMSPWYILLEILGAYYRNDKNTRMVSDEFAITEDGKLCYR